MVRQQNFKDDAPEGKFTEFYPNGKKHFTGCFKNRLKQGTWMNWDPNGKLVYKVVFDKGKKVKVVSDFLNPESNKPF